jgi:hypothetical protein
MFIIIIIIIIIIRNGAKTISLQTSFGDLIRNRGNGYLQGIKHAAPYGDHFGLLWWPL